MPYIKLFIQYLNRKNKENGEKSGFSCIQTLFCSVYTSYTRAPEDSSPSHTLGFVLVYCISDIVKVPTLCNAMKRKYKATNRKGVMDSPLLSPVLGRRFQMSFLHDMGAFLMFIVVTLFYMSPQGYADVGIQGMGVVNVHSPALIHGTDLNNSFFWTQRRLHEPDKTSDVTGDHADSSPLYLGAMAPLTGRHGSLGRRLVHAWIMAVDWINENFGCAIYALV